MKRQHEIKRNKGGLKESAAPPPEITPPILTPENADILTNKKKYSARYQKIPPFMKAFIRGDTPLFIHTKLDKLG